MHVWIPILVIAVVVVKSKLIVDYAQTKVIGVNQKPASVNVLRTTHNESVLDCAVKCTTIKTCLSFTHGGNVCALYESRIHPWETKSVKEARGFSYYYIMERCSTCPDQIPNKAEYQNINGRRVAFKACKEKIGIYEAMVACACRGGRLVAIVDDDTRKAVLTVRANAKIGNVSWIGLSGRTGPKYGPYTLNRSDGEKITEKTKDVYKNWVDGNPNYDREVGITMEAKGRWQDWEYDAKHPYICDFL